MLNTASWTVLVQSLQKCTVLISKKLLKNHKLELKQPPVIQTNPKLTFLISYSVFNESGTGSVLNSSEGLET